MTEPNLPIYEQAAAEHHHHAAPGPLERLKDDAERALHRAGHPFAHHHELASSPADPADQPQEAAMTTPAPAPAPDTAPAANPDLAEKVDAKIVEYAGNVGGWFDELRKDVKADLGPVVTKAQKFETQVEADPFIGGYLKANFAVPAHLVDLGLDFLQKLVSASGSAPETPSGIDAEPDPVPAAAAA